MEVEHVKAHLRKKEKEHMSKLEKFVTEGNEKADDLAIAGAMSDEGFMAETRVKTMQQEREEVYAALQYAASFHCLVHRPKPKEKWVFVEKEWENTKHRTEWCAEADKYRCVRCGRGSKYTKMPGKRTGPKFLSKSPGKWRRRHLADMEKSCYGAESVRDMRGIEWGRC